MSEEHKKKIGDAQRGKPRVFKNEKTRQSSLSGLRSDNWLGKKRPNISGKNHYLYNPNTLVKDRLRKCLKYRQWRCDVFERDNYTCQFCWVRGGRLQVDHIKPFWMIIHENLVDSFEKGLLLEELWNINNGRTLCENCHKKTDTYLRKPKKP